MKLINRGGQDTVTYHPAAEGKKSFITIPASMVENEDPDLKFDRAVAFGAVADALNAMYQKGKRMFSFEAGSLRDNSFEGRLGRQERTDLIAHAVKDGKKVVADEFATADGMPF